MTPQWPEQQDIVQETDDESEGKGAILVPASLLDILSSYVIRMLEIDGIQSR